MNYRFLNQSSRDAMAMRLKAAGHTVRKRTARGQVISPDYIADWPADKPKSPNGFGGSAPTYVHVLYIVEVV